LDATAIRGFAVLKPLKVSLVNVGADEVQWIDAPNFPRDKALGTHKIALTNIVYIEEDDFREADSSDYFGLAPGKIAGLRYGGYVKVLDYSKDSTGNVTELRCEYDANRSFTGAKVKGNIHWVSPSSPGAQPATAEIRLYDHLFTSEEPGSTGDWESEINPESEIVLSNCFVDASIAAPGPTKHFQFERIGFFVVDVDTDFASGKLVFNQTVNLKEDVSTKKVRGK
jgi:glutaminyl-tRNA synthetase